MGKEQINVEKLKLEKKAKKLEAKKLNHEKQQNQAPPPKPFLRSFHAIPNCTPNDAALGTFTVMSFNILGQCLVKRQWFPDSGDMLKWKIRRNMISAEIEMYKPDIMCLQEVDHYEDFYLPLLEKLGYKAEYTKHAKKLHGLLIAYNPKVFKMSQYATVDYDMDSTCPPTWITTNVGQVMALKHVDHPEFGLVVGNTHLYWRPVANYERLRQIVIFINSIMKMKKSLNEMEPDTKYIPMPIGDLNTTPRDPAYPVITLPELPQEEAKKLEDSRENCGSQVNGNGDKEPAEQEDGSEKMEIGKTMPTAELISILRKESPALWKSVYSCHASIDPETSNPIYGEPKYTNYTHIFKGTLDYIMTQQGEEKVRALELLTLPPDEAVQPSLPNRNFGSDHMCLMTKFEFTA
ncbi:Endonuclease/exonuclease/phosphatase [Fennellomyces sp. T-0311]|nr:Endonuclease/exonuclease/phosphatase [Fennellomyces sp. T-0311]